MKRGPSVVFRVQYTLTLFDSICCEKCHTPLRSQAQNVITFFFTLGSVLRLPYCIVIFTLLYLMTFLSNKIIQLLKLCVPILIEVLSL